MDRKAYAKQYWAKPEVKTKKMLEQREKYTTPEGQQYEHKRRRTVKSRFLRSRYNAGKRGKAWTISLEEFEALLDTPCTYCGADVRQETGSSLDRKDNERGYEIDNVNTCCKSCNRRRSKSMGADEFKRQTELNDYKKS